VLKKGKNGLSSIGIIGKNSKFEDLLIVYVTPV
jgi:hypothetical protein